MTLLLCPTPFASPQESPIHGSAIWYVEFYTVLHFILKSSTHPLCKVFLDLYDNLIVYLPYNSEVRTVSLFGSKSSIEVTHSYLNEVCTPETCVLIRLTLITVLQAKLRAIDVRYGTMTTCYSPSVALTLALSH